MSSSSSRSSSISTTDGAPKKKFCCSFPSCGKSFSRSEHLHRHALNHKDGNNTCVRCSAHFRRRDLLDRHMTRHKEKDDEAGGEGLGILATRKRLWRNAEGNIVNARRPSYTAEGSKRRQLSQSQSTDQPQSAPASRPQTVPQQPQRRARVSRATPMGKRLPRGQGILNVLPTPRASISSGGSGSDNYDTIVVSPHTHTHKAQLFHETQPHGSAGLKREMGPYPLSFPSLPSPPVSARSSLSLSHRLSLSHPTNAHSAGNKDSPIGAGTGTLSDLDGLYEESWSLASQPSSPQQGQYSPSLSPTLSSPFRTPLLSSSMYPPPPSPTLSPSSHPHLSAFVSSMPSAYNEEEEFFKPQVHGGDALGLGPGGFEWGWNPNAGSAQFVSRCREEKYEKFEGFADERTARAGFRGFGLGLGAC